MGASPAAHYGYEEHVPAAPNSLAPVAMNAQARYAAATGTNRAVETVVIRDRPTFTSGFMILLVGILAGGAIGVAMRAHRNAAEADAAAAAQPAAVQVAAQPVAAQPVAPVAQPAVVAAPQPVVQPVAAPQVPATAYAQGGVILGVGAVVPPQPAIVVTPPKTEAKVEAKADKQVHPKKAAPPPPRFGRAGASHAVVATKVNPPKPEPKPEPKPAAKPSSNSGGGKAPNDAVNVLKAAMGETENTL